MSIFSSQVDSMTHIPKLTATKAPIRSSHAMEKLRRTMQRIARPQEEEGQGWILPTGFLDIDQYLPMGGMPSHAVHEITGPQSMGFTSELLTRMQHDHTCVWVRSAKATSVPYGPFLAAKGLNTEQILFVECQSDQDLFWCMEEALKSKATAFVIGEPKAAIGLTTSRRFQLAAENGHSLGFVLSVENGPSNALFSRWHIQACPTTHKEDLAWLVDLQRFRGTPKRTWRVALSKPIEEVLHGE